MLQHFIECIRQAKSTRQQAVQMNIFTAVLCALKSLSETKTNVGQDDVRKAAFTLIMVSLVKIFMSYKYCVGILSLKGTGKNNRLEGGG